MWSLFAGVEVDLMDAGNIDEADGMNADIRFGNGRRAGTGTDGFSLIVGNVVSPLIDGVLGWQSATNTSTNRGATHSQPPGFPIIPIFGKPAPKLTTSGVKNPPLPPFAKGLSCLRFGIRPGISEAELRGMGLGESVGGLDVRDEEDRAMAGGSGNNCPRDGAEPDAQPKTSK